eukprot:s512_g33.t1
MARHLQPLRFGKGGLVDGTLSQSDLLGALDLSSNSLAPTVVTASSLGQSAPVAGPDAQSLKEQLLVKWATLSNAFDKMDLDGNHRLSRTDAQQTDAAASPVRKSPEDLPAVRPVANVAVANVGQVSNNSSEEGNKGLRQFSHKPPAEVSGRVSVLTPTTASRARFHEQLWQCFVDQTWPDKERFLPLELVVVETYTKKEKPSEVFTKLVKDGIRRQCSADFERTFSAKEPRLKYLGLQVDENEDFTVGAKRPSVWDGDGEGLISRYSYGPGDTKRQKLAAPTGKSFKLQCFGVKYDCKDLPTFDYTMDCCQFLEMQFDHVGRHDGLLETFIKSDAFPHLMQDMLAFVKKAKEGCSTIGVFSDRGRHRYCVNFDDDDLYATVYVESMVNELRQKRGCSCFQPALKCKDGSGKAVVTPDCWDPEDHEEYEGILYGYGFSYVYLRALALSFPYPNLGFAEEPLQGCSGGRQSRLRDAPFMLKLREKMGPGRVGLKEDAEGLCLHIVHPSSSTPDPEIETMLTEEELNGLVVSESMACRVHLKRPWFPSIWSSC